MLLTISFHAPDFYSPQGWQEFGCTRCDPPCTTWVPFRKSVEATRRTVVDDREG